MKTTCEKCGHEIDGNAPICMYCGTPISEKDMSQETKNRMETISKKKDPQSGKTVKAVGAVLLIVGIIVDVVSMFLIFSEDFSTFGWLTIFGTIMSLLGIALIANS